MGRPLARTRPPARPDPPSGSGHTTTPANSVCKTAALKSTEVGVTASTITVTVVADVNNSVRPGLFQGSWNGVKAWGDYMNSKGGLACRRVVVKQGDSKLSPTDAANAVAAACGNSVALVGTTALFLQNVGGRGLPVVNTDETVIADPNPKWTGSINSTLHFGRVELSTLFDIRHGGQMWDGTRSALYRFGRR